MYFTRKKTTKTFFTKGYSYVPAGRRPESLSMDLSSRALSRSPCGVAEAAAPGSSCATASGGGGASLFGGGTSPSGTFWMGCGSIAGTSGKGSGSVTWIFGIGSGSATSSLYSGTSVLLFLLGPSPSTVEEQNGNYGIIIFSMDEITYIKSFYNESAFFL